MAYQVDWTQVFTDRKGLNISEGMALTFDTIGQAESFKITLLSNPTPKRRCKGWSTDLRVTQATITTTHNKD